MTDGTGGRHMHPDPHRQSSPQGQYELSHEPRDVSSVDASASWW